MKLYFVTLLISLAATIYAAALDIDPAARALLKRAQEDINIVSTVLDNNLHRIDFYEDGKLEGYLLETEDGSSLPPESFPPNPIPKETKESFS